MMKLSLGLCGLLLLLLSVVASVDSNPVAKRETVDDLSPLNEVYVFQNNNDDEDDERSDRDKRKIGVIKLGVSNGIINFVFGKLDAFLEAKTKALSVLDDSNKAKNAAYDIDPSKSATSEFINKFLAQKVKASSTGVGPLFNAGSTFLSSAKQGLTGAFISKFAPLSSLSGGLAGGLSGGSGNGHGGEDGSNGQGFGGGSNSGSFLSGLLGTLSGSSGNGLSAAQGPEDTVNGVDDLEQDFPGITDDTTSTNAGFGNLGNGGGGVGAKY